MANSLKFRGWNKAKNEMITNFVIAPTSPTWAPFLIRDDNEENEVLKQLDEKRGIWGGLYTTHDWSDYYAIENLIVMQCTGLLDKNGNEIYEGDVILYKEPYRLTQTHTGENIPNGSYTEPLEPAIMDHQGIVVFENGCFMFREDEDIPLFWTINEWTIEKLEDIVSWRGDPPFLDKEEGGLEYLIHEVAKVKNADELLAYLNGCEIVGHIYQDEYKGLVLMV